MIPVWVIYEKKEDEYRAQKWLVDDLYVEGDYVGWLLTLDWVSTDDALSAPTLDQLQMKLPRGMVRFEEKPDVLEEIVEVWI